MRDLSTYAFINAKVRSMCSEFLSADHFDGFRGGYPGSLRQYRHASL